MSIIEEICIEQTCAMMLKSGILLCRMVSLYKLGVSISFNVEMSLK